MYAILTKSEVSFMYKMFQEIISMPRGTQVTPITLGSIPGFSRMTSLKLKPKPTVGPLLVRSPLLACTEHAQRLLLVCRVSKHHGTLLQISETFFLVVFPNVPRTIYYINLLKNLWISALPIFFKICLRVTQNYLKILTL